jgi:mRNA interferase MazF
MVSVKRGDVVLCDLNPIIGTEQAGIRPALVLQVDQANEVSPRTIIAPFTSKIRERLLPAHVVVPENQGGLTIRSVLLCEQVRAIDKQRIIRTLGHLDETYMDQVAVALRAILGV